MHNISRYQCVLTRALLVATVIVATPASATGTDLWGAPTPKPPATLKAPGRPPAPDSFRYVMLSPVYFDKGKALITVEGQQALDTAVEYIKDHDDIQRILIEGNADESGTLRYNDRLSDRRTAAVRAYLTVNGINPNLLHMVGKGELHPVDENWTRIGRSRNRQVAIYVIHGKPAQTAARKP